MYERAKYFVAAFLIGYAAIGFVGHVTRGERGEDLYPFFSWSLFAHVPERTYRAEDCHDGTCARDVIELFIARERGTPEP